MIRLKRYYVASLLVFAQLLCGNTALCQVDSDKIDHFVAVPTLKDSNSMADAAYYSSLNARVKGDDKEEEQQLLTTIAFNPKASGAYYDLSRISFKQNRADKAVEYIKKAIAINDSNVWYKRQYAEILNLSNKFEEAADQFMVIAKLDKNNDDDLFKAAKLYQHVGKYDLALGAIDMLLKKDAWNEDVLVLKKALYLKKNDVEGAANVVKQQIENNPKEGKYYAELAEFYDNNKMSAKAESYYIKAEQEFADDAEVQFVLAQYYKKKNNQQKYTAYIHKLITNKGIDAEQQLQLLTAYILENQSDTMRIKEGMTLCKIIVDGSPENANARKFYADVLRMNSKDEEALVEYKKSLQIDPSAYNTWDAFLITMLTPGQSDSLIRYTEKSLRLFPNQARLHYFNGIGYSFKKDYTRAIKSFNRAIDMMPEDKAEELADVYVAQGDAYNFLKQYQLSDESYDKAMKLTPNNATLLNNYAYYLSVRNIRLDDAERMSKKSLEIRKDEPTFLDTYGWVLYKQGKNEKAQEYIQKAIDISGSSADATLWEHLGDINYKLGNIDKAVECWKKSKEKGSENTDIDKKINDRKLYES